MKFSQLLQASEKDSGRLGFTFDSASAPFSERGLAEPGYGAADAIATRVAGPANQRGNTRDRMYTEARRLIDRVLRGDRYAAVLFQEALTTSDFAVYFGDVLDRSVLANYAETPYTWDLYCKRAIIRDFRQAKIFRFDRGASVLDGPIQPAANPAGISASGPTGLQEIAEYPMAKRTTTDYLDQLYKFGRLMDFSWETLVNDDLDALKDTPALFGRAARRTEEKRATELICGASGPNSTFFSTANKNILTHAVNSAVTVDNAHLSITSLQQALIVLMSQVDLDGEPISIEDFTLVYPPALDVVAKNILNATQVWMNDQGGTIGTEGSGATQSAISLQRLLADNWAKNIVKPAKNYYLPIVNTTNGSTAWYLFANPKNGRPALQQSFLLGHEMPELFMKAPNQITIGEGRMGPGTGSMNMSGNNMANPYDGDFQTDSIIYKIRHVLGGTLLDPIMALASTGVN
jgi:hypothetical protein